MVSPFFGGMKISVIAFVIDAKVHILLSFEIRYGRSHFLQGILGERVYDLRFFCHLSVILDSGECSHGDQRPGAEKLPISNILLLPYPPKSLLRKRAFLFTRRREDAKKSQRDTNNWFKKFWWAALRLAHPTGQSPKKLYDVRLPTSFFQPPASAAGFSFHEIS